MSTQISPPKKGNTCGELHNELPDNARPQMDEENDGMKCNCGDVTGYEHSYSCPLADEN